MLAQNRSGWTLLEYLNIEENNQDELAPFLKSGDDEMVQMAGLQIRIANSEDYEKVRDFY